MSNQQNVGTFSLRNISMRELEALMIILKDEGKELSVIKTAIDTNFEHQSRTKGYDYINNLVKKGMAYKKVTKTGDKRVVRIYVRKKIRSEYEKLILPTVIDLNDSVKKLFKDYMNEIKEEEKLREKFRAYTENILQALDTVLEDTPAKNLNKKKLKKKIIDTIWRYFRAEMLKTEMFSQ